MTPKSKRLIDCVGDGFCISSIKHNYVNLDNAATTPAAVPVMEAVRQVLGLYGSVHRGSGLKSVISTDVFEKSLDAILRFVGGDDNDVVVMSTNCSTAINRFASGYGFSPGEVVLISEMEHSSNELPWRKHATVARIESRPAGRRAAVGTRPCTRPRS
jgi:selenocysteine lyase/cysteine desulfurase